MYIIYGLFLSTVPFLYWSWGRVVASYMVSNLVTFFSVLKGEDKSLRAKGN